MLQKGNGMATLHFASGNVTNQGFDPAAAAAGFNLADVGDADTLNALPEGVRGLYYLDEARGVTSDFIAQMNAIKGNPKLFAVYLADEPVPSEVSAADLRAESDWIHANMPGVKTFIVADNMGSNQEPNFNNYYTVDSTHIDLWGLDPYPVRSEMATPDYTEIDRTIIAAEKQIGVSAANIVPVFQAFGGVNDGDNGQWVMPTVEQERAIINQFAKFVPNPVFDYTYSWMQQNGDTPLSASAALQQVLLEHNSATVGTPSTPVPPPPVPSEPTTPTDPGSNTGSGSNSDPQGSDGTGTATDGTSHSHHHRNAQGDSSSAAHHHNDGGGHDWSQYVSDASSASEDTFHFGTGNHVHHQIHMDGLLHA